MDQPEPYISRFEKEIRYYMIQHNINKASDIVKRLLKFGNNISLNVEMNEDKSGSIKVDIPDEQTCIELAVALRIFLTPKSEFYIENIINFLSSLNSNNHQEFFTELGKTIQEIKDETGPIQIRHKQFRAEDVYVELMDNIIMADDVKAIEYDQQLARSPEKQIKWFLFYSYCKEMYNVLMGINRYIIENQIRPESIEREWKCIYCTRKGISFTSVEHIIPEFVGNQKLILPRGFVCDECNTILSGLENQFSNMMPINILNVYFGLDTKKGRFPSAKLPEHHIVKTRPNVISMRSFTKKSIKNETTLPDGTIHFNIEGTGRFKCEIVARTLMKMILGIILFQDGPDEVFKPRYDQARNYILEGGAYPNFLIMPKSIIPRPGGSIRKQPWGDEVFFIVTIFGFSYIIGIDPRDHVSPDPKFKEFGIAYDLRTNEEYDEMEE